MRWGRRWGTMVAEPGFRRPTRWGAEDSEYRAGRQQIRLIRGRIVPCDSCKRLANCAMYQSFTRKRLRSGEYLQGTNILHMCDIYFPNRIPKDIRSRTPHGRTSGIDPT